MRFIPNHKLVLARIPDPDGDLSDWPVFAHTINGYEVAGSFEARRDRHSGGLSPVEPAVRRLLRAIREKVANQELS